MADPFIGQELGGYRITRLLKRTGMSMIYLGWDAKLQREVVVKIMLPVHSGDESFAARFQQEALATARLAHPNIVHIYDFGQRDDLSYMVMEYLPGGSLHDRLVAAAREGRRLDPTQSVIIIRQVALALDHAHQAGIIHRDVKPSNILFARDGRPVLTDLGIARAHEGPRLTKTMTAVGTPEYMSPEQGRGDPVDGRSDIYSLGVVLYELLAGALPFQADTAWGLIFKHMQEPPPPLEAKSTGVSPAMRSVVEKALAKRPGDRFQTAQEMAEAIQRALEYPAHRLYAPPPEASQAARPAQAPKFTPPPRRVTPPRPVPMPQDLANEQTRLMQGAAAPAVAEPMPSAGRKRRSALPLLSLAVLAVVIGLVIVLRFSGILGPSKFVGTTLPSPVANPTAVIEPTMTTPALVAAASPTPSRTLPPPTSSPTAKPSTSTATRVPPTATVAQPTFTPVAPTMTPAPSPSATRPVAATQTAIRPTNTATTGPQTPGSQSAPAPIGPANGARFSGGTGDVIQLTWQGRRPLAPGEKYVVVIRFAHNNETWTDDQWTDERSVQAPSYLLDYATSDRFEWQVQVAREDPTGVEFGGSKRRGVLVGVPSAVRAFYWTRGGAAPPGDGGGTLPTWTPAGGGQPAPTWTPAGGGQPAPTWTPNGS